MAQAAPMSTHSSSHYMPAPTPSASSRWTPSATRKRNARALQEFTQYWGLSEVHQDFLMDLPDVMSDVILAEFTADGTKDGDAWGRLLGFVRSIFVKQTGLDRGAVGYLRGLPEEEQMAIMARFDFSVAERGRPGEADEHLRQVSEQVLWDFEQQGAAAAHHVPRGGKGGGKGGGKKGGGKPPWREQAAAPREVVDFAQHCGLGEDAIQFLNDIAPETREVVLREFDPSGTKDGNVLGRLEGFVRVVEKRLRSRAAPFADDGGRRVRGRRY
eukprot:TRINITY_DN32048_c0_g1_i2.p1 TRINITY_DN32048_c0_g1~~TRINITY_DN32048_c0_g1_i2.p1  ORF type:complete len:271 (-),score=69.93 TRINITY_DN32048_c0_g1_i2:18-830(-)